MQIAFSASAGRRHSGGRDHSPWPIAGVLLDEEAFDGVNRFVNGVNGVDVQFAEHLGV